MSVTDPYQPLTREQLEETHELAMRNRAALGSRRRVLERRRKLVEWRMGICLGCLCALLAITALGLIGLWRAIFARYKEKGKRHSGANSNHQA